MVDEETRAALTEIRDDVGQLKNAVLGFNGHGGLLSQLDAHRDRTHVDVSTRLRALEKFKHSLPVSIVALALSAFAAYLGSRPTAPPAPPEVRVEVVVPSFAPEPADAQPREEGSADEGDLVATPARTRVPGHGLAGDGRSHRSVRLEPVGGPGRSDQRAARAPRGRDRAITRLARRTPSAVTALSHMSYRRLR